MTEDFQKRAMAVDYAVKLSANLHMGIDDDSTDDAFDIFMSFVEAIYFFLKDANE